MLIDGQYPRLLFYYFYMKFVNQITKSYWKMQQSVTFMEHIISFQHNKTFSSSSQNVTVISSALKSHEEKKEFMKTIISKHNQNQSSLLLITLDDVVEAVAKWKSIFPTIPYYYPVKVNNDIHLLKVIANLGGCFDCASLQEIAQVLSIGVSPDRIIFANPIKPSDSLRYANEQGVHFCTFDSENELKAIATLAPKSRLLLRIYCQESHSVFPINKFGVSVSGSANDICHVEKIISTARELGLLLEGVAFHVGSRCLSVEGYRQAIRDSKLAFQMMEKVGFSPTILDIGGGFIGTDYDKPLLQHVGNAIHQELDLQFQNQLQAGQLSIIAEPGRALVQTCVTQAACVIGKKPSVKTLTQGCVDVFLNDGVYGTFKWADPFINDPFFGDKKYDVVSTKNAEPTSRPLVPTTLYGPTCDNYDKICYQLPMQSMDIEDWLVVHDCGAYIMTLLTDFNDISKPIVTKVISKSNAHLCE